MILNSIVVAISVQEPLFIDASSRCGKCGYDCTTYVDVLLFIKVIATVLGVKSMDVPINITQQSIIIAMGMYKPTKTTGGLGGFVVVVHCFMLSWFCCQLQLQKIHKIVVLSNLLLLDFSAGDSDDSQSTIYSISLPDTWVNFSNPVVVGSHFCRRLVPVLAAERV